MNYPMIGDPELKIAKLYDMLPAGERRDLARAERRRTTPPCAQSSWLVPTRRSS